MSRRDTLVAALTSYQAKAIYATFVITALATGLIYLSYLLAGLVATVVYVVLFGAFLTLFPFLIALFGAALPGSGMVGALHGALGAFAFGGFALVQTDDEWQLCPARRDRVYVDGAWHAVPDGQENLSRLWWNRFGILRFKTEDTLADVRADVRGERRRGAAADGGAVDRGGYREQAPPGVSGDDGKWIIDLKRLYSHGIRKMGDIELIETAEEITSREHAKEGVVSGWESLLAPAIGLIIGLATGYFLVGGV